MTDYVFDFALLGGGLNDLYLYPSQDLGLATDTAYLDTDATRPTVLTYASSLKGCIEMLQRDFPTKEIIIHGLHNSSYGSATYSGSKSRADFMADLQIEIAQDYGIKIIPNYFCEITNNNYNFYTYDTVHFNDLGSSIIVDLYRKVLNLHQV